MLCLGRRTKRSRDHSNEMLVSECSLFASKNIKICVISAESFVWSFDVSPDFSVDKVKLMALGHFYNPSETIKAGASYKLVLVSKTDSRKLSDDLTLAQEGVKDNDELLLLRRRVGLQNSTAGEGADEKDANLEGPDEAEIKSRTAHLSPRNEVRVTDDVITVVEFQPELHKILISLISAAQKVQQYDVNALPILRARKKSTTVRTYDGVDPAAVKQLTDMGFSEAMTVKALKESGSSPMRAMEWLLQNQGEVEERSRDAPVEENATGEAVGSVEDADSGILTVSELLEAFKVYKRKEFRPNIRALDNLKEMGFSEDKIVDALRVAGNNQDAACEWLLGEKLSSAEDLDKGLDCDGPIYKAIMANPVVQLGLGNPKTLLAFLHMLENANSATHWLNDPDTAPLLSQIFKIYHAEKHSLQIRPTPYSNS